MSAFFILIPNVTKKTNCPHSLDGRHALGVASAACTDVEWECPDSGKCILKEYVCDEYAPPDCDNGEDEDIKLCQSWRYPPLPADTGPTRETNECNHKGGTGLWQCAGLDLYIKCRYVCDEHPELDCPNGSDEEVSFCGRWNSGTVDTTAAAATTTITTAATSSSTLQLNGSGDDESEREEKECNANEWKCPSDGSCIFNGFVCDYFPVPDCPNGEDEAHALCSKWKGGTTTATATTTTTTVSSTTRTLTSTSTTTASTTTHTSTTTSTTTASTTTRSSTTASTTTKTTGTSTTTSFTSTTTSVSSATTTTLPRGCCIISLPGSNGLNCIDDSTKVQCDALESRLEAATGSVGAATTFALDAGCSSMPASCPQNSTTTTTYTTATTTTTTYTTTTTTTVAPVGCCVVAPSNVALAGLSCIDNVNAADCTSLEARLRAVGQQGGTTTSLHLGALCSKMPSECPQGSTTTTTTTTPPVRGCCVVRSQDPKLGCVDKLSSAECSELERRILFAGGLFASTSLAVETACTALPDVCPHGSTTTTTTTLTRSSTTITTTAAPAGCCVVTSGDPALSCLDNSTEAQCGELGSRIKNAGGYGAAFFSLAVECKTLPDACPQGTPTIQCSKSEGCAPPLRYCAISIQLYNGKHRCIQCSKETFLANGECTYRLTCKGPRYEEMGARCTCRHAKDSGVVEKNCHRCTVYKNERIGTYLARKVSGSTHSVNLEDRYVKCYGCSNDFYFYNGSCISKDSCLSKGMAAYDASSSGSGYRNFCDFPFTCYKKTRTTGPKAGQDCKCLRKWPGKRRCRRCDWGPGVDSIANYKCTDDL